jgi:hypothetical protein
MSRLPTSAPNYAGLRSYSKARSTGTIIGVYDGIEAELDTDGGRWQTVCEPHGWIISHRTLALALSFASCPEEWCDYCSGQIEPTELGS